MSRFWGRYLGLPEPLLQVPNGYTRRALLVRVAPVAVPLLPLLEVGWALLGLPVFALAFAVRWALGAGWGGAATVPPTLYLHASNDRNVGFVPASMGRPAAALVLPFRSAPPPGGWASQRIDLRQVTTRGSVFKAAFSSVRAAWRLLRRGDRDRVLFTYSAPRWFWVYEALQHAPPKSLWISNHSDRWAALAASFEGTRVTMVQHGALAHRDLSTGERLLPTLHEPLPGIERVFVTDEESERDFQIAITGPSPHFELIRLALRSEPWPQESKKACRVLVVGHPAAQRATGSLIAGVLADTRGAAVFAYRPHPTEGRPVRLPNVDAADIRWLDTGEVVPEVDIVVSYGSSVTEEIVHATGGALLYWEPNAPESLETTRVELVNRVRSKGASYVSGSG